MERYSDNPIMSLLSDTDFIEGQGWHRRHYPAYSVIFEQGDESRSVYFIVDGSVQASGSAKTTDGKELKPSFTTLEAGELFGELVLFDELPRSARVATVEETEVIEFDGDELLAYMERHPEQGYRILKYIVRSLVSRLRRTNEKLFSLYSWGLKAHGIDKHL
jgi:CRP/FNR family cyclic AMP-dependent transcriptional regulator